MFIGDGDSYTLVDQSKLYWFVWNYFGAVCEYLMWMQFIELSKNKIWFTGSGIVIFPMISPSFFTSSIVSTVTISVHQWGIQGQDVPGFLTLLRWCHFLLQLRAGEVSRSLWIRALAMEIAPLSKYHSESAYYAAQAFSSPTISHHLGSFCTVSTGSRLDTSKTSPEIKEMIHVGDTVLEINGISVQNIPLNEVRYYIHGVIYLIF